MNFGSGHRGDQVAASRRKITKAVIAYIGGKAARVDGVHMQAARAVEKAFVAAKKSLPINVDGAIGAILADLGMIPATFNGIFMIARTPGLMAHVIEEQTREKPMRRIDPVNHGYDGPPARNLPS